MGVSSEGYAHPFPVGFLKIGGMMVHPMFKKRLSFSKAPDYSAKADTVAFLKKEKQTPSEADYKPASGDSRRRCHECKYYSKFGEPESDCQKVIGIVVAAGTCDVWAQRDYPQNAPNSGSNPIEITIKL